jgi:hypothetical protein
MRRTCQDLAREAGIHDVITRAISGHATEAMQRHYSTARDHEVAAGLAKVIDLAATSPDAVVYRARRSRNPSSSATASALVAGSGSSPRVVMEVPLLSRCVSLKLLNARAVSVFLRGRCRGRTYDFHRVKVALCH